MSTEGNKAIVRRFINEFSVKRNLAIIDQLFALEFVNHSAPPGFAQDREGFRQFLDMYLKAFPDLHLTIEDMLAEDDKVVVRVTARGTHQGSLFGAIPPTGKQATVPVIVIWRIADGKMVERWELVERLGIIPTPAQG